MAIEQDKVVKGLSFIKEGITISPQFVKAHTEYIRIKTYWLDKGDEVQIEYNSLMKKEPNNPVYPLALALGLTFSSKANKENHFNKVVKLAPDWSWGHLAKARLNDMSNPEFAISELLAAIEKESEEPLFYTEAIALMIKQKKLEEASIWLKKLPLSINPVTKMNLLWDWQLAKANHSPEALQTLNAELERLVKSSRDINSLKAVRLRFKKLKYQEKVKEAENKILAIDPNWYPEQGEISFTITFDTGPKRTFFAGRQNQISRLFQEIDYEANEQEQIEKIEALFTLGPNPANKNFFYRRLLILALSVRDFARAVKYGELILADEQNQAGTLANLARVYAEQKSLGKALEYSKKASELTEEFRPVKAPAEFEENLFNALMPESRQKEYYLELRSMVLNSRAFVLEAAGNEKEAEALLRQVLLFRPSEETYSQLEKVLRKLGHTTDADQAAIEVENLWRKKITANFKNEPSKDFELTTIQGKQIKLSELKGKVVIINYWATWCTPCLKEMPILVELYNKYKPEGLEILAVSVDSPEDRAKIAPFIKKIGVNFPVLYDDNSAKLYGVVSYPTLIFVDREGNLRYRARGLDRHHAKRNLEFIISELMKNKK